MLMRNVDFASGLRQVSEGRHIRSSYHHTTVVENTSTQRSSTVYGIAGEHPESVLTCTGLAIFVYLCFGQISSTL